MPQQKIPSAIYPLNCQPGIQRDGTLLASRRYTNGQWVRFYRGLPKKMGGYRQINGNVNGPARALHVWSRQGFTQVTICSPWGVESILIDANGVGQALYDRTPSAYAVDADVVWQMDTMYDAAALSTKTLLFAFPGSNLTNIDSTVVRDVYYGDANDPTALLQAIGGSAQVSGGIVCASPYLVMYGSDGRVSWSNENEPRNLTTGSAGTARVTGSKIVKGLPIRGAGTSPSVLLWALDAVIRMTFVGGTSIFRFDPITNASSILSSNSVVEFDGVYYWIGLNRFMMYDGRVHELPNDQNSNWFFDGLNFAHRQKVHAVKVPRYGEIWWYFPKDGATECSHAVIYNVREGYWYDVQLSRTAGATSNVFRYPLATDAVQNSFARRVPVPNITGFIIGDTLTGGTSGATGKLVKANGGFLYIVANKAFISGETVAGALSGSQTSSAASLDVSMYSLWMHEFGHNMVTGDNEVGISSFFDTCNVGFPIGGPTGQSPLGSNNWTRFTRVEPDFKMHGQMTMQILSNETAASIAEMDREYTFDNVTQLIDLRNQSRELRLRFRSTEADSDYELGRLLLHMEEGDGRS